MADFGRMLKKKHAVAGLVSQAGIDRMLITGNLMRIYQQIVRDSDAYHRQFGWTWAGFRVLNVLWAQGDSEIRDLARLTGSSRAAVSSVVNTLESVGAVRRVPAPSDRRLVIVQLTESGMAQLERAIVGQSELQNGWLSRLGRKQQHELAELLSIVADTMEDQDGAYRDGVKTRDSS